MFDCSKCGIQHRRSSKKGKEHLRWEKKKENGIPSNKYFKITKKQFKSLSPLALRRIWTLYKMKKISSNNISYTREINKVLLTELKNLNR